MKIIGKILLFNATEGTGIIITANKDKIHFNVEDWDDFDAMPSLGLEVSFKYENSEAHAIVSLSNEDEDEDDEEEYYEDETDDSIVDEASRVEKDTLSPQYMSDDDSEETEEESEDEEEYQNEAYPEDVHFKEELELDILSNIEDIAYDLDEREESVTISLNLSRAVSNYFNTIKKNIDKRERYKKVHGRLNYLVIRRFLWTTYNNLTEIDLHIITPKTKALHDDLLAMSNIYDDFMRKIKYPPLAYAEVFLSCQAEYMKIKTSAEKTIEKLNRLRGSEKFVGKNLKIKKEELQKNMDSEDFDLITEEFKSMNGAYVDIVHMMAELDERYKHDMELLSEFEDEYREDFYDLFESIAVKYKKSIVEILSAQAFALDDHLWHQARTSKAVKAHFHKAGISGEFNTKTYLKYFLDTQDTTKMTAETTKLYELYEYLVSLHKDYIIVVMSDAQDAMDYASSIKFIDKSYDVKSFIDEKSALKWAMRNSVKIVILEDRLSKIGVETFLKYYKRYILLIPQIIVIGRSSKSEYYPISKMLASGISPRVLAENVKELIPEK